MSHLELREQVGIPELACLWTWACARDFAWLTVCEQLSPLLFIPSFPAVDFFSQPPFLHPPFTFLLPPTSHVLFSPGSHEPELKD